MKNKTFLYGLGGAAAAALGYGFWLLQHLWHGGRAAEGGRILAVGLILGGLVLAFGWLMVLGQSRPSVAPEPPDPLDPQ